MIIKSFLDILGIEPTNRFSRKSYWGVTPMKKLPPAICLLLCVAAGLFAWHRKHLEPHPLDAAITTRSHVSPGDPARLQRVFAKARRGEPITIGFIGGSITHGQAATSPERSYANLVSNWWITHFPQSHITVVNAGLNGTDSTYGVLRVQRDLLSHHPDFVLVEFGVNDHGDLAHAQTYEGLVRQILADPDQPAVLLLFLMHHDGTSAQDFQEPIGKQYALPMVSYRDALWPEITARRLKWSDITDGVIHPNDRGHAAAAQFVNSMLQEILDRSPAANPASIPTTLPVPHYTDLFQHTELIDADKLQPVTNSGWIFDDRNHCWYTSCAGSVIEFDATGRAVDLLYERYSMDGGTAQVTVNDQNTISDAWFDATWEGFCRVDEVCRDLDGGTHRVRVQILGTRNPLSTGYDFRIMGLGIAK
jgi:lysophospholipase L1-like esterase